MKFKVYMLGFSVISLVACSQDPENLAAETEATETQEWVSPIEKMAGEVGGKLLEVSELEEDISSLNRGDYENTDSYKDRLKALDSKYGSTDWVAAVVSESHRWQYDADSQVATYSFNAMGSLNLEFSQEYSDSEYEQLWPVSKGDGGVLEAIFIATPDCPLAIHRTPAEARDLNFSPTYMFIKVSIESFSANLLGEFNKKINIAWDSGVWSEPMVYGDVKSVVIFNENYKQIAEVNCL